MTNFITSNSARAALVSLCFLLVSANAWSKDEFEFPVYKENSSSLVGLRVTSSPPAGFIKLAAHTALFVKIDRQGALLMDQLYMSSVSKKGNLYLFDFDPGEYALVASIARGANGVTTYNYLREASARETVFSITEGQISYLGRYVIKTIGTGFKKDDFQKSVISLFNEGNFAIPKDRRVPTVPNSRSGGGVSVEIFIKSANYSSKLKEIDSKADKFLKKAPEFFANTEWKDAFNILKKSLTDAK